MNDPISYAALRCRTCETICMPNYPVSHIATIASAGYADPIRIYCRIFFENMVGKAHYIIVIYAPVYTHYGRIRIAMAVASPRVAEEYEITHAGPKLHLVNVYGSICGFWAAVNIKYGRIAFGLIVIGRLQYPAGNDKACVIGKVTGFGNAYFMGSCVFAVIVAQLRDAAGCFIQHIELLQLL